MAAVEGREVTLRVRCSTHVGESLAVTGAAKHLGGWRKEELVHMVRDGRDRWAGREVSPSSCPGTCGWPVWAGWPGPCWPWRQGIATVSSSGYLQSLQLKGGQKGRHKQTKLYTP